MRDTFAYPIAAAASDMTEVEDRRKAAKRLGHFVATRIVALGGDGLAVALVNTTNIEAVHTQGKIIVAQSDGPCVFRRPSVIVTQLGPFFKRVFGIRGALWHIISPGADSAVGNKESCREVLSP